jgi:hypothetical protein
MVSQKPVLQQLAWQLHGIETLSPQEAWSIYSRNARHLRFYDVSPAEQAFMIDLKQRFGDY